MTDQQLFDFSPALPEWAKKLGVFDLETTGLDLTDARIVTACAVELDEEGAVVGENSEWLADPVIEIPEQASAVHGVTTEIARRDGRPAAEVVGELLARLQGFFDRGLPVVAYNAPYDFTILHYEAIRHGLEPLKNPGPILDPLVIDKFKDKYRRGKRRLENAAEFYQVSLDDAHNATADAIAAGRVAQAIARRWAAELPASARELHELQIGWSDANDSSFEEYMQRQNPDFVIARGWPLKL